VVEGSQEVNHYTVDGIIPRAVAIPQSETEVAALLTGAAAAGEVVVPWGAGSAQDYGTPLESVDLVLSLERLNQVVEYVPADMTITVQAGMRFADLQALTAKHRQTVPLDPPRSDRATVGGLVATAASGPRRMAYGGLRDLVLGVRVALPNGRIVRAGGKVVKNVAGYDLTKLVIGSLGTLGVVTEVSLRLRPLPADTRTLLYGFTDVEKALSTAEDLLNSELLPAALCVLTPEPSRLLEAPGPWCMAIALEESAENNEYQVNRISKMVQGSAGSAILAGATESTFWKRLTNFDQCFGAGFRIRLNSLAGEVASHLYRCTATQEGSRFDGIAHVRGSTLLLHGFAQEPDRLRDLAQSAGERAVIESAPVSLRRKVNVWGAPQPSWRLTERIKEAFDPGRLLNRGRFVGGV
jgi:glycolate oxidase FAD binding subunit